MICDNLTVSNGRLLFAGQDTVELARQYGTPLYLMDEDRIRANCQVYTEAFRRHFGPGARPLYASKANSFQRIYEIMREEGMGIDVVSSGEIYTALRAGYDLGQAYFHSNNKTDEDIRYSMDHGIGYFVADNVEEIKAIEAEAARRGIKQRVLLRLTPGIDPHTYEAIATGKVDSKFGSAIETGQAEEITLFTLRQPHVELVGFHCHVGSQVFAEDVFERAAVIMLEFAAHMEKAHCYQTRQLDLGGGYGVRYVECDPVLDVDAKVAQVAAAAKGACARLGIALPEIHMEPGRSIVGDAGLTLYTVGTVKEIPGPLRPLRGQLHLPAGQQAGPARRISLLGGGPLLRERRHHPGARPAARERGPGRHSGGMHHRRLQLLHGLQLQPPSQASHCHAPGRQRVLCGSPPGVPGGSVPQRPVKTHKGAAPPGAAPFQPVENVFSTGCRTFGAF